MSKLERKQTHRWEKRFILRGICFSKARKLLKARCCSFERMDDNHVSGWSLQGITVHPTSSGHSGCFSHDSPSPKRPPLWNEVCWKSLRPCICRIYYTNMFLLNAVIYWKMSLLCINYLAGFCSSKIQVIISIVMYIYISYYIYIHISIYFSWAPPPPNNSPPGWAFANGTISLFLSLKLVGKKGPFWLGEFMYSCGLEVCLKQPKFEDMILIHRNMGLFSLAIYI